MAITASCTLSPASVSTPDTVASSPGRSRDATSTRHSSVLRAADTATRARATGRKRLEQRGLAGDVARFLGQQVRARRGRDALRDRPIAVGQTQRFGAPPFDQVAGVEPRQIRLLEHSKHDVVELVDTGAVPRLQPAEGQGEEIQRPGALGAIEVRGEREHPLLVEAVDPLRGGSQQARVAHE